MENPAGTSDESFLRWRISIEEGDQNVELEEFGSEQLLRTVVRTSYLYHLRQSLRKNLEASKQKDNYAVEEAIVNKVIKGCSAILEEKALRHCMIAKLYQRVMAQTIKDVKKATTENNLYTPLQEFAEQQSKVPTSTTVDKEVQTEFNTLFSNNQIADLYSQTEAFLQRINPIASKPVETHANGNPSNIDCDRLKAYLQERSLNGATPLQAKHLKAINGLLNKTEPEIRNTNEPVPTSFNGIDKKTVVKRKCDTEASSSDDEASRSTTRTELTISSHPAEESANVIATKSNAFEVRLRSPTFAESVAIWYNLECEIEEMPPAKKQKLEEKFVQLFGVDHGIDYYFLTDEQKSIACRKRIAKFVVMELTSYYVKKKIASKQLFKTLAKHITSMLLGRSLYPSPEEIKRSVEEFFLDDRIINSEDDFYF